MVIPALSATILPLSGRQNKRNKKVNQKPLLGKIIAVELVAALLFFFVLRAFVFVRSYDPLDALFNVIFMALICALGIVLLRNVSSEQQQRKELESVSQQLQKANTELKNADHAKTEFLSVTSHQLRTPLTAIKGYISMLQEGDFGKVTAKQRTILDIVFASSQRLTVLIADLLDLSRIESGKMDFDFEAVNLDEIIETMIAELAPKAKQKGLYIYFDKVSRDFPRIRADVEKIGQVVLNLLDNAVKYTVSGGVTVRLARIGDSVQFSVADTGIGIEQKDQRQIFEKFFRAESADSLTHEGTGLGAYVVKKNRRGPWRPDLV